jgi:hypothetical protein
MKILIISLPRSGSTSLMFKIAEEKKLKPISEPFDNRHKEPVKPYDDGFVIKTIVRQYPKTVTDPIEWYVKLSKEFDETILLSRRDLKSCTESLAYLNYFKMEGFQSNQDYFWKETPNYKMSEFYVNDCNDKINQLSEILNMPVIYYEDIFDVNSENRLRKGNKGTPKELI